MVNMRSSLWLWAGRLAPACLAGLLCLLPCPALAHETDNFSLPLDTELADLGDYLETVHTRVLDEVVRETNSKIEQALKAKSPPARARELERLHDPATLANAFLAKFGHRMSEDIQLERALRGKWAERTYPGKQPSHRDIWMNFSAHVPLDPRQWGMLYQSHTIRACGSYFGTDKIVHFHHLGVSYYTMYRSLLKTDVSPEAALREVIRQHTQGGILAESALLGSITTGIYSNADLAANLAGFKFFLNLTEPVVLKGQSRAPLLVRNETFWRLNHHVRPRTGWLCPYVSDHWNEALNPSLYEASMRPGIRRVLISRAEQIVQFYTRRDGRPNDPVYFDNLARELSTYDGEPYGHSGQFDKLMTIGNTCIPALQGASATQTN
jgi:hypothetical protein